MAELSGLAAVVTGGGSGIGLATARLLASRDAKVAVLDLKPGDEFTGLYADVTDDASVREAISQVAIVMPLIKTLSFRVPAFGARNLHFHGPRQLQIPRWARNDKVAYGKHSGLQFSTVSSVPLW